ncbi:hypothetical protein Q3O60_09195 [Alkalimonas collagenimarina]|uniref:Polysaccharide deacetylase n=1 Tax=Alkalimonas collagenimarina TaxID=400390 RepID=A0ABT9GZS2_9GAMM|nr:hypothetical protein [Alkalimonas collagenimarina]MDP4536364.1 hypothetical protein [Alkalimonas collagenimarina]
MNQKTKHVNVFITIDTEVWNFYDNFTDNFNSAIHGRINERSYGLEFQLDQFAKHNLKANFFVDPLFSLPGGQDSLKEVVQLINKFQQDVQLHIHTEWLEITGIDLLGNRKTGYNIASFSADEQIKLLGHAKELLVSAGATKLCAFRAGNYGANTYTLSALAANDIYIDTSYNRMYLDGHCGLKQSQDLLEPQYLGEVLEYPISFYYEPNGNVRHVQVAACSFYEMKAILEYAHQQGWPSVVIVLHSFEWIKRIKGKAKKHVLDPIVLQRFDKLCKYLAKHEDRFKTQLFSEQDRNAVKSHGISTLYKQAKWTYFHRQLEQVRRKINI